MIKEVLHKVQGMLYWGRNS